MTGSLKDFALVYAKMKGLSEFDAGMLVGALSKETTKQLDTYKDFMLTLNQVAPQLIQLTSVLGKADGQSD